jgi:Carboxypeptidase regulatory-like domain/TonB dependent receptor-like, beta-barrel
MEEMFRRVVYALACVLALTLPVIAQEQTGQISGVVKDSSGAVLPGVAVEAKSLNTGAVVATVVSDGTGVFRFIGLRPGKYDITAKLQGFTPAKAEAVDLRLGQILTVDLSMSVGGTAETIQVTAESPLIDTKQAARQTNIRDEQIALLPHGRDFTSLVTQAPGANQEAKLGGLSIDGASAGENRYIIDGVETTNLQSGLSGTNLIVDFVDELQVKSSGYTAEFGGAMGGVISAVTKSGTNDYHGSASFQWLGDKSSKGLCPATGNTTICTGVPTLRASLTNSDASEYVTYPQDKWNRVEPGFSIGGPIAKDKLWFFGAYQPAITKATREVTTSSAQNPSATASTTDRKEQVQYLTGNVTASITNNLRTRVAYNNSWSKNSDLLAAQNGLDPAGTNYSKGTRFPNWNIGANADWVVSPKFVVGVRGGYRFSDTNDFNVTEEPLYRWTTTNNIGFLDVPAALQHGTNFTSIPTNTKSDFDKQTRAFFHADGTAYLHGGGEHQIKFGVQADRVGNKVLTGESRPRVTIRWDTALSGVRGPYGYYSVRSQETDPVKGFITEGDVHTNNLGFFVQDAWTVNNRLTINAGLRTERERVPSYTSGFDANDQPIPEFGIEFGFKDKLAPRIGAAYDIAGDGKWKVFGSWGVFYDIFKLELPRGSFGGDKWIEYYYTLDTYDWPNLLASSACPPACPGTFIRSTNFRLPSFGADSLEPDLKPMKSQEATLGLDHELNATMAVGVHYVHKQLDRTVEDTGFLTPAGDEGYVIANPSEGLTALAFTNPDIAMPKPKRKYDSVEFFVDKRFAESWSLRASYLWSRLYGNYTGLTQSDENGRTSPNVGRSYDYPAMMFDEHGQPVYGHLPTDRPHQVKVQGIYQFNFGTAVGLNEYVSSGLPVSRELGILPTSNYPMQYLGRGSDGRTDVYSQTDLFVQHEIKIGASKRLQFQANIINLFNQSAAVSKFSTYQKTDGITFDEVDLYSGLLNFDQLIAAQGVAKDPRFLLPDRYQAPIQARFGVKFLF